MMLVRTLSTSWRREMTFRQITVLLLWCTTCAPPTCGCADATDPTAPALSECPRDVDAALEEAGVSPLSRADCGSPASNSPEDEQVVLDCYLKATSEGTPVQLTISRGVDTSGPWTYIASSTEFHVVEIGSVGGADRVTVRRCENLELGGDDLVVCTEPEDLYECVGELEAER